MADMKIENVIQSHSHKTLILKGIAVFVCTMCMLSCGCRHQPENRVNNVQAGLVQKESAPLFVQALVDAYPEQIVGYDGDSLVFADGSRIEYDDGIERTWQEMLYRCDVEDMAYWNYDEKVTSHCDPGRIRNEELFKKMYGDSEEAVRSHFTTIEWCPNLVGQKLHVTTVNGVADQLQKVSDELNRHPEWKDWLTSGGIFNWRVVAGTDRLSPHSFAIAIDIGVSKSNYWRWDYPDASETDEIVYRNSIPLEIVKVFEKHGFIWGGWWYHYDTMHFEYRPEIFRYIELQNASKHAS